LMPPNHPNFENGAVVLDVNVQWGALSVTNPPVDSPHLPEIDRVVEDASGGRSIERVRASTLSAPGEHVLTDAQLLQLFDDVRATTDLWLAGENATLSPGQRRSTLTLDLEFRTVKPGWPALLSGVQRPSRTVVKQARTLEPSPIGMPDAVANQPIPRDVLARALRVERVSCVSPTLSVQSVWVTTDPRKQPDVGFSTTPFAAFVVVDFDADQPSIGKANGDRVVVAHTNAEEMQPSANDAPVAMLTTLNDVRAAATLVRTVDVSESRIAVSGENGEVVQDTDVTCTRTSEYAAPEDFLRELLLQP
jgi:hypothetical protein